MCQFLNPVEKIRTAYQFKLDALQPAWELQRDVRDVPVYHAKTWIMCVSLGDCGASVRHLEKMLQQKAECSVQVVFGLLLIQRQKQRDVHSVHMYYEQLQRAECNAQ